MFNIKGRTSRNPLSNDCQHSNLKLITFQQMVQFSHNYITDNTYIEKHKYLYGIRWRDVLAVCLLNTQSLVGLSQHIIMFTVLSVCLCACRYTSIWRQLSPSAVSFCNNVIVKNNCHSLLDHEYVTVLSYDVDVVTTL